VANSVEYKTQRMGVSQISIKFIEQFAKGIVYSKLLNEG
jgi:hypothetical protein